MNSFEKEDIKKLLICNTHLGTKTCQFLMKNYTWIERKDGIFIINIFKTLKKLKLAARAIVAVKNSHNIIAISTGDQSQKAVVKFSSFIKCQNLIGKWTAGKFTNHMCSNFQEPELIILANPQLDYQPLVEASRANIPSVAFCNTDTSLKFIDIAIPGNNSNNHSIALLWWMLTREVLIYKGIISKQENWDIPVNMFLDPSALN
jgi:small subunit ribosomal protein SAe